MLLLSRRNSVPPNTAVRVDRTNPLTRGVVNLYYRGRDVAAEVNVPASDGAGLVMGAYGPALSLSGSNYADLGSAIGQTGSVTYVAVATVTGGSGQSDIISLGDRCTVRVNTGSDWSVAGYSYNGGGWDEALSTYILVPGVPAVFVFVHDIVAGANTLYTYQSGVLSVATTAASPRNTGAHSLRLGLDDETSRAMQGVVWLAGAFNRAYSPAEGLSVAVNPWQLFKAPARRLWLGPAAGAGVTGTLASTQALNTASLTGSVAVSGTEAATQVKNTDAITGTVAVSGTEASTQAPNAGTRTGTVAVSGTEAATQAPNAGTRTGSVAVSGTLGATQALNTAALTGTVATGVTGTLASTQAPNTDALAGTVGVAGSVSVAQSANVTGASGTVAISGTQGATQAPNTAALVGAVGNVATGTIASTQAANTDALTATVAVSGTEAATQAPNAGTRTGSVGVSGTEAATQAKNTDALAGAVAISGSMAATQLANTFAGAGTVLSGATGTIAATQAPNTASITAVTSSGLVSNPLYLVAAAARNYSSVAGARNYTAYK